MIRAHFAIAIVFWTHWCGGACGSDWPQWLGPNRDSVWAETGILRVFPPDGPTIKWRKSISGGYAGPAVADKRLFITDYVTDGDQTPNPDKRNELQGKERILCLSIDDGEILWQREYDCPYNISYPAGPRTTPTVDGERVYTLGAEGNLHCMRVSDGSVVWSLDFKRDLNAKTPLWGFCGHPLIDGDKLICIVGGNESVAVALDKHTGNVLWKSLSAREPGYCPPTIIQAGGTRQLLIWHSEALNGLNPDTGEVYWSERLNPNYGMSIATPRQSGDYLFVGGIVNKSMLLSLAPDRPAAEVEWYGQKGKGIDPVNSTPFIEDGFMYGVDRDGQLCCVKISTGEHLWSTYRLMPDQRRAHSGTVFLVKNDDRFFIFTDSGELVIAQLSPARYHEIGRAKILQPTSTGLGRVVLWSHPAFANRCMFARNDNQVVCVSLAR